jgi:hypothetical protein
MIYAKDFSNRLIKNGILLFANVQTIIGINNAKNLSIKKHDLLLSALKIIFDFQF